MKRPDSYTAGVADEAQKDSAAPLQEGPGTARSRSYERRNPAFAFRIRPEDNERLAGHAEALEVSRDALARALVQTVLDAVEEGRITLAVERQPVQKRDRRGRLRSLVRSNVSVVWGNGTE